ncbi:hypothetical protein [Mycobacterium sp. 663a-19]|uniref:hypothetical protein n=1 Tax=Mycobacterium sp. 663a-19 TaxID=2986148 RepID=UPI003B63AB44
MTPHVEHVGHVEYVAHHYLLLAAPAFLPAVIVAGVVLYIALRDRRAGRGTPHDANQRSDQRPDPAGKKHD